MSGVMGRGGGDQRRPRVHARRRSALGALFAILATIGLAGAAKATPPNGTLRHTWEANDTVFSVVRHDASIFIGGDFTYVGPHTGGGASARLSDGTLDQSFPVFDGGKVWASVDDGNGGLFLGGNFTLVNGVPLPYLVHVLGDGRVDLGWHPQLDGAVHALVRIGSTLYIGGEFLQVGGAPHTRIAAIDAASAAALSWNPGETSDIDAMIAIGNTLYIATGDFVKGGQIVRSGLAAVDASTGDLRPFDPNVGLPRTLAAAGTTLYLGGLLMPTQGQITYAVAYDTTTGTRKAWAPGFDGLVYQLAVDGNTVYASGEFTSPTRYMAAVDATTGVARAGWQSPQTPATFAIANGTTYLASASNVDGVVQARVSAIDTATGAVRPGWQLSLEHAASYVALGDGHLILGGDFIEVGGVDRLGVAELDAQTGQARALDAGLPLGSRVFALAENGGTLYVGGYLTSIQGHARTDLAALDLASGHALSWAPALDCPIPQGGSCNTSVWRLAATDDAVYVAGTFNRVNGVVRGGGLAAIDQSGAVLPFDPHLDGVGNGIKALLATPSAIYVGGVFAQMGGAARQNLAALDPVTGNATAWNPSADGAVAALATDGTTLFVGGIFGRVGGVYHPVLAGVSTITGATTSFSPSVSTNIEGLAVGGGYLFVAGGSGFVSGAYTDGAYGIEIATGAASTFASPGTPSPIAVAATADGNWVGFGHPGARGFRFNTGPARSGFSSFSVVPAPAPPTGGGSGGGGGGGGGGQPNLVVTTAASTTTPATDSADEVTVFVRNAGVAGSTATHLHIALPPTITLLGAPYFERGSGCNGTQSLDCFLDFIPSGMTTKVVLELHMSGSGTQTITASAPDSSDSNPADNSASLTLQVGVPLVTPSASPPSRSPASGKTLKGTSHPDDLNGTAANDTLLGMAGNDVLRGGKGNDTLVGGPGADLLDGGPGLDKLLAGPGNDTVRARDGQRDIVDCGTGRDVAYVDRIDKVTGCELLHRG